MQAFIETTLTTVSKIGVFIILEEYARLIRTPDPVTYGEARQLKRAWQRLGDNLHGVSMTMERNDAEEEINLLKRIAWAKWERMDYEMAALQVA